MQYIVVDIIRKRYRYSLNIKYTYYVKKRYIVVAIKGIDIKNVAVDIKDIYGGKGTWSVFK